MSPRYILEDEQPQQPQSSARYVLEDEPAPEQQPQPKPAPVSQIQQAQPQRTFGGRRALSPAEIHAYQEKHFGRREFVNPTLGNPVDTRTFAQQDPSAPAARRTLEPIANIVRHPLSAALSASMGVAKGATLGLMNKQVDKATEAMPSLGLHPSGLAEGVGEFAGIIAPWEGIAGAVTNTFGLIGRSGHIAAQAAAGGIVGATEAANQGRDDAPEAAVEGAAFAGALTGALELPSAVKDSQWFRMLTNKERGLVVQTVDDIATGLRKNGWDEGRVQAKLARLDAKTFQSELNKRMAAETPKTEPAPKAKRTTPEAPPAPVQETVARPTRKMEPAALPAPEEKLPIDTGKLDEIKAKREASKLWVLEDEEPATAAQESAKQTLPPQEALTLDQEQRKGSDEKLPAPTPKTDDAPAEIAKEPAGLRPAIRDGRDTIIGNQGSTHPEILSANDDISDKHEKGFVADDGEFMTRSEAKTWMKENRPEVYDEWVKVNGEGEKGELHSQDMNAAVEKVESLAGVVDQPNIQYRMKVKAKNSALISPPVGKKFSEEDHAQLSSWLKSIGLSPLREGNSIRAIDSLTDKHITDTLPDRPPTDKEVAAFKAGQDKAKVKQAKVEADEKAVEDGKATPWIHDTFGKDSIGSHNLARLVEYLDGASPQFNGLMSHKWEDGLKKLGISTELPAKDIAKKIKEAYQPAAPASKEVAKQEAAPQWYINPDDRPVLTSTDDAKKGGYRGPYSKDEVSELTGTHSSYLDETEQGKPVYTPDYPEKVTKPVTFKAAKPWKKPVSDIAEGDEARLTAAQAQELADAHGNGTIQRITNQTHFDKGLDSGNPEYGHRFAFSGKKPVRGITSFAIGSPDDIVDVKVGNEGTDLERAKMVHYGVRPSDIGGEFIAVRKGDGAYHLYSDTPVDTSRAQVVKRGQDLHDHYKDLQQKGKGVTHDLTEGYNEADEILKSLGVEIIDPAISGLPSPETERPVGEIDAGSAGENQPAAGENGKGRSSVASPRDGYGSGKNSTDKAVKSASVTHKAAEKGPQGWGQTARIKDGVITVTGKLNTRPHELYPDTPDHTYTIPVAEWERTYKHGNPHYAQYELLKQYSPLDDIEAAHARIRDAQKNAITKAMLKVEAEGAVDWASNLKKQAEAKPAAAKVEAEPFSLANQVDGVLNPREYLSGLLNEYGDIGKITVETPSEGKYDYYTLTITDGDTEPDTFIERAQEVGLSLDDAVYGNDKTTLVFEFPKEENKIEVSGKEVSNEPATSAAEGRSAVQGMGAEGVEASGGNSNDDGRTDAKPDAPVLETAPTGDVGKPAQDGGSKGTGARSGRKVSGGSKKEPQGGDVLDGRKGGRGKGLASSGTGGERASGGIRPEPNLGRINYHIADPERLIGGTPKVRFKKNRDAIEALLSIQAEGRTPTPQELDSMASYTGWGSFGQELFNGSWEYPRPKPEWETESQWLQNHLGKENWQAAQASIINAHYTDPPTVQAMWEIAQRLGFDGGRILEPSIGIGNFFGLMPPSIMNKSRLAGIELDKLTGGMAKILYPQANIQIKGYQESQTADGFYDLVIGNWPFAKDGPADRRYRQINPSLHDYFFLKALDQTRPGGLVIGVTSSGTMDKIGKLTRMELARKAQLVAAFRLPSGAFEKYAGTSVVTDIIILQKRETPISDPSKEGWLTVSEREMRNGTINTNEYWDSHPEHILGEMDYGHGTTRGRAGMIVNRPENYGDLLKKIASKVPENIFNPREQTQKVISYITNNTKDRQSSITIGDDKKLYVVQGEYLAPLEEIRPYAVKSAKETRARESQITSLVEMRKAYGDLIDAERQSGENTEELRKALAKQYESFIERHGNLNGSTGLEILRRVGDPFYSSLAALEVSGPDGYRPATILSKSTVRGQASIDNPTVKDAYVLARNENINIDLTRVAALSKQPLEDVTRELVESGAVYLTPAGHYEVSDQYLSGNVRRKLREAEAAQAEGADMTRNIEELKKIMPPDQPYFKIEAKLGAPWVSVENYKNFVADLLGEESGDGIDLSFRLGAWKVKFTNKMLNHKPEAHTIWGVDRYHFDGLVQAAMNNSAVTIWGKDENGNRVVDATATAQANEKAGALREEFSTWVWKDAGRKIRLEQEYNEVMNCTADTKHDGSFLTFPGMALTRGDSPFNLRKHQSDAVWRGLLNRGGLYAHEVGTGKTFTIAGLCVESRRYGIAKKPLVFAHNANSATVARESNEMYPAAKVLYVDNLSPDKIDVTMRQIANDDWDMVVVPHSLISRFGLKRETLDALAAEEIEAMEQEAMEAAEEDGIELTRDMMNDADQMKKVRSVTAKQLVHARNAIIKKIENMAMTATKENAIPFEDLGVDMVVVDEAHEFKKPPITTKMRMKGLNTATSGQSLSLHLLSGYVKSLNAGKGIHLFTGTPVTNTLTEIYHMMRYVMDDEMERNGIKAWDSWFNTFADSVSDVELTAAADYEAVTRLAAIVNVPELRRMAGQYTDIVFADDMPEFKPRTTASGKNLHDTDLTEAEKHELMNGRSENPKGRPYKKTIVEVSPMGEHQKAVLEHLVELSKHFRNASAKERREIMLTGHPSSPVLVETAAANAGMDVRLFDKDLPDHPDSKVNKCVKNVLDIYRGHGQTAQVIFMERGFSDKSTSVKTTADGTKVKTVKERFNLAKDIVDKLVEGGIPRDEISIIDGSTSKEKRKQNADNMNSGKVRVTIGNTKTLGVGVNMQDNLRAIHHLDAPWMPGELEQRNGRGWRQGNRWNTLQELRYVTEKLDGRRWQVLVVKDRFIKAYLKAKDDVRVIEGDAVNSDDEGMSDLTETLSEAAGDPRILLREKYKKDIDKLQNRERTHAYGIRDAEDTANRTEAEIAETKRRASLLDGVISQYESQKETFSFKIGSKSFPDRTKAQEALDAKIEKLEKPTTFQEIGQLYGFNVAVKWSFLGGEYEARLSLPGVTDILARNKSDKHAKYDQAFIDDRMRAKTSIRSMEGILRNIATHKETMLGRLESKAQSVKSLRASAQEPFPRAADLAKKQQMLADLMLDMDNNPVPPPSWLRHGAPVGGEVFYKGKEYPVVGHKWDDQGYSVLVEKGDKTESIPYMEATDENGLPVYEEHDFEPPVVAAPKTQAAQSETATADFMGLQQAYESLSKLAKAGREAIPHLETIGKAAFREGASKYQDFVKSMKQKLGDLWNRFKGAMETVWDRVTRILKSERGAIGKDLQADLVTRYNQYLDKAEAAVNARDESAVLRWLEKAEQIEKMMQPEPAFEPIALEEPSSEHRQPATTAGRKVTEGAGSVDAEEVPAPRTTADDEPGTAGGDQEKQRTTGIKNAVTEAERETQGKSPVEVKVRRTFGAAFDEGKALVDSGQIDPRILAASLAQKPRALNAEESVALIYDRMRLQNDHAVTMGLIEKAAKEGDQAAILENRQRLAKIEDDINTNDLAARRTGYEQGLGLAARKMMIAEDYSLARTVQRVRAATGLPDITDELREKLEDLTHQLNESMAKSQEYEEKIAKLEAEKKLQQFKREAEPMRRKARAEAGGSKRSRNAEKSELESEYLSLATKLKAKYGQLNMFFDPEDAIILGEMMRNRVLAGMNNVSSIVDDIYDELKDIPEVTRRDIRDAISGYGKSFKMSQEEIDVEMRELRRQMRLVSSLEDAQSGKAPTRSGLQRDPISDEVRDLQKQVKQAMRESGIDEQATRTPEQQWKTSLDAVKTRLKNQIHDLSQQIETGKKTPKKIGIKYDQEAEALKAERDRLKEALVHIEGKKGLTDEQRVRMALNAVQKSIAEYERRIATHDLNPKAKTSAAPDTPELNRLRSRRDALKETYQQMQKDARPVVDPEEAALKAYKTRTQKRLEELQTKLDTGDFEKRARRVLKMDPEAMRLKNQVEKLKEAIDTEVYKQKHAARTSTEKALDWTAQWRRAVVLSSVKTIGKLSAAAAMRQITTPIEELIGGVLSKVPGISRIAKQAPREGGGLNVRAEAAAFSEWFKKRTWQDFLDVAKTGRGELDRLYGHKRDLPPEAIEFFGRMHGALKNTPKRAEFHRGLQKRTEWAMNHGLDVSDPMTQATLAADAYVDANRAIFMNDNALVKAYRLALNHLRQQGPAGHAASTGMQVLMPVVKIPTNFVAELSSYVFGAAKGAAKAAFADDINNLPPEDADYIMRALKKQGLGLVMLLLGYYGYKSIGGYYQQGEKRKAGEPKAGELGKVPKFALHTPALEVLQVGATLHRVQDTYAQQDEKREDYNDHHPDKEQKEMKGSGTGAGIFAASVGMAKEVPFLDQPMRMAEALKTTDSASKYGSQLAESMVVPPDLRNIAKMTDKAGEEQIPRQQDDLLQMLQGDIPGQRSKLPLDMKRIKKMDIDRLAEIMENAPVDVAEKIRPVFSNKFRRARNLSDDDRERYRRVLE